MESKWLKLLTIGILDFLGINCSFLVRKNICCHLLDFILHSYECKVGPIFWHFYLEKWYHCLLSNWFDTNLCVWSVPYFSANVPTCEHSLWEPFAGSIGHQDFIACSSPISGGFYSFLQVSGGSSPAAGPCFSVLHDSIPGFSLGLKKLLWNNASEVGKSAIPKLWKASTITQCWCILIKF